MSAEHSDPRHRRGRAAEDAALALLLGEGLSLQARNYRCRWGEIDLVMSEGSVLVFVEVRMRRSLSHGGAIASVDRRKCEKLRRTALHYLQNRDPGGRRPARFDLVAVDGAGRIDWQRDVIQA